MTSASRRRSVPGAIGISILIALVAAAMSFFASLFIAIVIFLIRGSIHGGVQNIDFSETYRVIALPIGIGGLVGGFFWSLVNSLRRPKNASHLSAGSV